MSNSTSCRRTSALVLTGALVFGLTASACSDSGDDQLTATTAGVDQSEERTTTTTVAPPVTVEPTPSTTADGSTITTSTTVSDGSGSVPVAPEADPALATALFWARPIGGDPVSLPAYQDPASGPVPLVLYGSITNTGSSAVAGPGIAAVWRDAAGAVVLVAPGTVVDLRGGAVASLAPGASVDVVIVVDPERAAGLDPLSAELIGTST